MELLTSASAKAWCEAKQLFVRREDLARPRLQFDEGAHAIRIPVPASALHAVALAYVIIMTGVIDDDERNVDGGLIWMVDWDIGSDTHERVGLSLLSAMRGASGGDVLERPCQLFCENELAVLHTALALPLLFQWDAFFVPISGEFIAFASHDGFVDLTFRSRSAADEARNRFQQGKWELVATD